MHLLRVLILLFLTAPVFGQIKPRLFEFGPKIGVNLSYISPDDTVSYSQKPVVGLQGGLFGRLNYKKFSFQPEIIYQAKGSKIDKPLEQKHQYRYISTPVLLGYSPIKYLYVEAGYEQSWALNKYDPNRKQSSYGPGKSRDRSLLFGTRFNLLDAFSLFSLSFRYVHGLDNVTNLESNNTPLSFKNRSIQMSISYTFSEQYLWNKKFGKKKN